MKQEARCLSCLTLTPPLPIESEVLEIILDTGALWLHHVTTGM